MTLHCLFSSDPDGAAARDLRRIATAEDAILFHGAAVRIAQSGHPLLSSWRATGAALWVLEEDLRLFAVSDLDESVSATDQSGFVALAVRYPRQMAWR
jgi:sulfur relay protein TusB/DsrH